MPTLAPWVYGHAPPPSEPLQTDTTAGSGNALQACVAALLGVPLERVPNFITLPEGYEKGIREYVAPRLVRKIPLSDATLSCLAQSDAGAVVLLRGGSPRGGHGHVVLARLQPTGAFEMLFDPHPDGTFLDNSPYGWAMLVGEPPPPQQTLAFVFPLMAGDVNPSFPIARQLVARGHHVHYLCFSQFRDAIEDTGATFHDAASAEPELYATRTPGPFGAMQALTQETPDAQGGGEYFARVALANVQLELQLPGVLRWLAEVRPAAVVYDPVISREAAVAAKLLDIPAVALLAFAGPAAWADTVASKLRTERKSAAEMQSEAAECAANVAATDRINAWCGLGLKPRYCNGELEPIPKLTLVTTTRALAAPASAELQAAHAAAGAREVYVGPLLDVEGALRAGGFKTGAAPAAAPAAASAKVSTFVTTKKKFDAYVLWPPPQFEPPLKKHELIHQAIKLNEQKPAVEDDVMVRVHAARAAGRRVVLASMGTVATGDHPTLGWRGTPRAGGGLTGAALCRAAWGGMFDAVGGDDGGESPLLVVVLGPQKDPLGDLPLPPNAVCAPNVPLVDILRAGVAAFLTHGGQNSFMEALSQETPLLVCPTAGDQFDNARLAARLGIGLWADRPDPDAGGEAAAAAAYRAEVAAKLTQLVADEGGGFKRAVQAQAASLASAGGVPRAAEVVLAAAARAPPPEDA